MTEQRPIILLVEDNPSDALLVRHSLRREYEVDIATDGKDAMSFLEESQYLLAIIDYKLPGMSGLELLAWMRGKGIQTPAVVVSGQGDERVATDALKQGAYDYVIKSRDSIMALPIVARQALRWFDLEQRNRALSQIVQNASDAVFTLDEGGGIVASNPAVKDMFGIAPEEAVGRPLQSLLATGPPEEDAVALLLEHARSGKPWKGALSGRRANGQCFPVKLSAFALAEQANGSRTFLAIVSGPRKDQELTEKLERLSCTDELTGLHNHRHFRERLREEFLRARRYHHALAVMMLDLDNFKSVNDTYGHPAGDETLTGIARILAKNTRSVDIVTRYGGDEFAILLPNTDAGGARVCADDILQAIGDQPIVAQGRPLRITASVGIAALDLSDKDEDALLRRADKALYGAKHKGRNNVCSWEEAVALGDAGDADEEIPVVREIKDSLRQACHNVRSRCLRGMRPIIDEWLDRKPFLREHVEMVEDCSTRLAEALGMSRAEVDSIRCAALFHDLGHVATPDSIFSKEGPLTPEERERVNKHVLFSEDVAAGMGCLWGEAVMIRHHHERYGGMGFPDGTEGDRIPLGARILSLVDAYAAMTSARPFRPALPRKDALAELRRCAGEQFDPALVNAFLRIADSLPAA